MTYHGEVLDNGKHFASIDTLESRVILLRIVSDIPAAARALGIK